jgi:hypothetical protein
MNGLKYKISLLATSLTLLVGCTNFHSTSSKPSLDATILRGSYVIIDFSRDPTNDGLHYYLEVKLTNDYKRVIEIKDWTKTGVNTRLKPNMKIRINDVVESDLTDREPYKTNSSSIQIIK